MSIRYLLDTNIISELMKPRPNAAVFARFSESVSECAISSVSVQEIEFGLETMPEGRRKTLCARDFSDIRKFLPVLDFTEPSAEIAGTMLGKCQKIGSPRPHDDTQIAATAIANGLVLVSRNEKDFEPMREVSSLQYENWFVADSKNSAAE